MAAFGPNRGRTDAVMGAALRTLSMVTTKAIPAKGTECPASTSVAERVDQQGEARRCRSAALLDRLAEDLRVVEGRT